MPGDDVPAETTARPAAGGAAQLWRSPRPGLRGQLVRAGLVGVAAGGVAVLLMYGLTLAEGWRERALTWAHHAGWGWLPLIVGAALLAGVAGWLTSRYAPEAGGSGIPHIKGVLHNLRVLRWRRVLPVKLLGGFCALASGLSLGREGPTVQLGGAMGQAVARWLKLPRRAHNQLIAAGSGAGLAAAFNAPLAGFVFTIEELQREMSPLTYATALIASVAADIVTRSAVGQQPAFHVPAFTVPPMIALPAFVVLGLIASGVGIAFNRLLLWVHRKVNLGTRIPRWARAAAVAATLAGVAWFLPLSWGGGYSTADKILAGGHAQLGLGLLALLLVLRLVFTTASYGTGVPGGIFAPMLAMGAILGLIAGRFYFMLWPDASGTPVVFAVVGMAAVFAAVVRAPLTGVVLVLEMTANYHLLLPLMLASLTSYLIAARFHTQPVYEALLNAELEPGGGGAPSAEEPAWVEVVVEEGSVVANRKVAELRWPEGCLLVTITRGLHDLVPSGGTRLRPGDFLRVVVESDCRGAGQAILDSVRAPE